MANLGPRVLALVLASTMPLALAEDFDDEDDGRRRCINTGSILQTKIIDDNNIVFIMRRDQMYLNTLRNECRGLYRRGGFAYKTQTRNLCELERITVLEAGSIGAPLGRSCTLGTFQKVTMDDLAIRFAPLIRDRQAQAVAPPPIEEIGEDEDDELEEVTDAKED